ncbi:MAG: M28 family peptidase [Bacteroidota bacterium]
MRILKKVYPNPKRTILVGHWSSEEQGLNGSRAFVEDHPEIVNNLQALFNQDNGTGRVTRITGQDIFTLTNTFSVGCTKFPQIIKPISKLHSPEVPVWRLRLASFVAAGAPGFSLSSLAWSYGTVTWHTNLDTYDKIVFDDLRNNAILTAILVYQACEDPNKTSREKSVFTYGFTNQSTRCVAGKEKSDEEGRLG